MNARRDILIVLIIVICAAAIAQYFRGHNTFVHNLDTSGMATTTEVTPASEETLLPESASSTMTVKIALLGAQMDDSNKADFRGCDLLVMSDREVPYSTTPLNAAFQELFSKKDVWMSEELAPGNFVASQTDLFFDYATLTNGTATIYLVGQMSPLGGECDDVRLKTAIEETAKQFPTVKAVDVYINGVENDLNFSEKGV